MTAIVEGSGPFGGGALLPVALIQVAPHVGVEGEMEKPLKHEGAFPPGRGLFFAHCDPQKLTVEPGMPTLLLTTKAPLPCCNRRRRS